MVPSAAVNCATPEWVGERVPLTCLLAFWRAVVAGSRSESVSESESESEGREEERASEESRADFSLELSREWREEGEESGPSAVRTSSLAVEREKVRTRVPMASPSTFRAD